MDRKQVEDMLKVDETFDCWREAYRKVYGKYPKVKLVEVET